MIIRLTPDAIRDLEDGIDFYNGLGEGVGAYFHDSISADIDSLVLFAGIHASINGCHYTRASRFPFIIWYRVSEKAIVIVAVLDGRMEPDAAREKLNRRLEDG